MAASDDEVWGPDFYYTDGSGGSRSSDTRARRCGCGIARVDVSSEPPTVLNWAHGSLPGAKQSVPRAELYAILVLLRRLGPLEQAPAFVYTDSKYVFDKARVGPSPRKASGNSDLWKAFWAEMVRLRWRVCILKIRAHCDHMDLWSGRILPWHYFGNKVADVLAGEAAQNASLVHDVLASLGRVDALAWRVQKRLVGWWHDTPRTLEVVGCIRSRDCTTSPGRPATAPMDAAVAVEASVEVAVAVVEGMSGLSCI